MTPLSPTDAPAKPAGALPPGPKGRLLVGALPAFRKDPVAFLLGLAATYGDISHFKLGSQAMYFMNHPDHVRELLVTQSARVHKGRALERSKRLIGEGLLTSEGAAHKRQRLLIQPAFHKQRIEGYAQAMVACALTMHARWQDGSEVNMAKEMHRLTLAIVARTLFDADVESDAGAVGHALEEVLTNFDVGRLNAPAWIDQLPLPSNRRFGKARAALDATIYRMIEERRASGEDRGDLLSMLLAARDEEGDGQGMSDEQVRDEAMTLFLAGHETTANALVWTWYLLAEHPEVAQRLHAEVDAALADRPATFADLPALPYVRQVLSESMRLYPPAWVIGRRVVQPVEIAGYTLPVGAVALVSPYVLHHDERFFPDPERFAPERWTPEETARRPRFAYFPFGAGPRLCVGEQFAWTEGILLLATLARHWRPALVPGQDVQLRPTITLAPRDGLKMKLVRRN